MQLQYIAGDPPPQANGKSLQAMVLDREWNMSETLTWLFTEEVMNQSRCVMFRMYRVRGSFFFPLHEAQQTDVIILDAVGAHIVREKFAFPCEKSGSYLRASRLAPGTVGAKARTNRALASQISTPLSISEPPCSQNVPSVPNSSRFSSALNVSRIDAVYDDLLEPIPSLPISYVLEEIEFGRILASMTRPLPSNYLPSVFAAQPKDSRSDVWICDSGVSCHMPNDATTIYCGRPPPSGQREVTTSDGTGQRVEYVGNFDMVIHGRSNEPITLCDVSYVPSTRFIFFPPP